MLRAKIIHANQSKIVLTGQLEAYYCDGDYVTEMRHLPNNQLIQQNPQLPAELFFRYLTVIPKGDASYKAHNLIKKNCYSNTYPLLSSTPSAVENIHFGIEQI